MAEWVYKAIAPDGQVVTGTEKAASENQLESILRDRGSFLLESRSRGSVSGSSVANQTVKPGDLIDFSQQLAILVHSGVPLVAGLGDLIEDLDNPVLQGALTDVHGRITQGELLSAALSRYPRIFDEDYVHIVAAGEESGELAECLDRMASSMEWRLETARRFKSAFAYPAVLITAVIGLLTLIVTWLIPRLSKIFIDAGVELPALTKGTLAVADFLKANYIFILGILALLVVTILVMRSTVRGRTALHACLLRLPLAGPLANMIEAANFSNTMGLLLNAGIPMVRALEITCKATRNLVMRRRVEEINKLVLRGRLFSEALREVGGFPSLVLRMVGIGEQSGSLVEALDRTTAFFDKEVPRRVKKFLGILEPTITLTMGVGVCFAVFSAFLPMVKLLGALKG